MPHDASVHTVGRHFEMIAEAVSDGPPHIVQVKRTPEVGTLVLRVSLLGVALADEGQRLVRSVHVA